jgi:hypothetical protein
MMKRLSELKPGDRCTVLKVEGDRAVRRRLLDIGGGQGGGRAGQARGATRRSHRVRRPRLQPVAAQDRGAGIPGRDGAGVR